ncbi:L,D-transpeptidase family protein [Wenxinia marina]|uniref:L,D-TPase catalytic domain-containing protein n=1 Tax=Wenxinia marina DSM 24838 TaxID=1123501 RepID=A0A0D0QCB6_9RHOB|nr:L,D-transpeptidase [Wenxinia marina]KIQ69967.1 hypothetical protein Wenmar_01537 [Wenxinia marina DSM 24838]GGL62511.1 hypothetical protein GCM10011392_16420 [Wenxinia marina]
MRPFPLILLALAAHGAAAQNAAPTLDEILDAFERAPTSDLAPAPAPAAAPPQAPEVVAAPQTAPAAPEAATDRMPTPAEIESVTYAGGPLPEGRSALTVKLQILLDRSGISPGVIDGWRGGMSESAIAAFETRAGLPVDGILDPEVWAQLGGDEPGAVLASYTVVPADLENLSGELPSDYALLAQLPHLGHERASERIAEFFHMTEEFLIGLNPGATFQPGETLTVAALGAHAAEPVAAIVIDKTTRRLTGYDAAGNLVVNYPVTVGSTDTPSPSGHVTVERIALMPEYSYNPENFIQGDNMSRLTLPPGPNGPVGSVWIALSKPSYGIHGTPEPSSLFRSQSHGCVRLTNWDAEELAGLVTPGVSVVFQD